MEVDHQQLGCIWQKDHLISMGLNGHLSYLDPNNPSKPRLIVKGHNKFITSLAVDKSQGKVYTGAYDAIITAWDIPTGNNDQISGGGHTNQINEMHLAGSDIVTSAKDDSVRFVSTSSKSFSPEAVGLGGEGASVSSNKDGSFIVAAGVGTVNLIRNKKSVGRVDTAYGARAISISPDEKEVAVGGEDQHVYVYSVNGNSLTLLKKIEAHRGPLSAIAYSPDGKYIASGDTNRELYVFNAASKDIKVSGWVFHTARINSLAWSPDSVHVVSGSLDQNLIVWNVNEPTNRIVIKGAHHGGVNSVAWIDNNTIASAGQDCSWRTWTVKF